MIFKVLLLSVSILVCSCGSSTPTGTNSTSQGASHSTSSLIGPVTNSEKLRIEIDWAERDLEPKDIRIVHEDAHQTFKIYIIEHTLQGYLHYGAVIIPNSPTPASLPIFVMPDGLDQSRPVLDMDQFIIWNTAEDAFTMDFIQIYPAFRGRTLQYNGMAWSSPGDFCDAYDGATDDTMAFLTAALSLDLAGNTSKILGIGISRGGNTVFQLGIRDPRISTIIAMAGPTDFNRTDVRMRYGSQYTCQFITGKSPEESRDRIIASSPIYFSPRSNIDKYFIFQGGADPVVPPWNSVEMADFLTAEGQDVTLYVYPNEGHGSFWELDEHSTNYRAALDYFILSLEQ